MNSMLWIYIPPIILVAALTALVVILGRKSSDLKKFKNIQESIENPPLKRDSKEKIQAIGRKSLHALEKLLFFFKYLFKKTEGLASSWAVKLRARRSGKKHDEQKTSQSREFSIESRESKIMHEIEKVEELSTGLAEKGETTPFAGNEVVIRRKIPDQPLVVAKPKVFPEDKVREAALIYRIAENPKDMEAYREIGDYYLGIGNIRDAKESFKMVLKLRPRDLKAKSSLREIEMRMRLGS